MKPPSTITPKQADSDASANTTAVGFVTVRFESGGIVVSVYAENSDEEAAVLDRFEEWVRVRNGGAR